MKEVQDLFSLNNIRSMEVVDLDSGKKLGFIKDLVINCEDYKIISILLPEEKVSWFGKENYLEIPWNKVHKIGEDVILVQGLEETINLR
nr:YlmC/YmxH family sporulation protein [Hathewaya histolytica]